MVQKEEKSVNEILEKIDDRVEYLKKLDKIREERKELNHSSNAEKVKDGKNTNGKIK